MNKVINQSLVSVIIPTYNHAEYLREAIVSVKTQTYKNWELIIINNFSDDNTIEIVESFNDERIKLINFSNKGIIAASRNIGLQKAKGEYIAFLDSDDIWSPNKLEKQLIEFKNNTQLMLCSTNCDQFPYGQKNLLKLYFSRKVKFEELILVNKIINSSVMIRRNVIEKVGLLDETPELRAVEDYDYWIRISIAYPEGIKVLKDRLLKYRLHDSNTTGNSEQAIVRKYEKIRFIYDKHDAAIGDKREELRKKINNYESEEIIRTEYYRTHNMKELLNNKKIKDTRKTLILIKGIMRKFWE